MKVINFSLRHPVIKAIALMALVSGPKLALAANEWVYSMNYFYQFLFF